jgi:predicted site-specific integrase-resolvase
MSTEATIEKRYTDKEFCEMYGIDRRTSKRWRDARLIGYIRTPTGQIRYLQRHIDAYEKRNEKKARAA